MLIADHAPCVEDFLIERILCHVCRILQVPGNSVNHTSSFLQLGGHSLLAYALSRACRADGIQLPVRSILESKSIIQLARGATQLPAQGDYHQACTSPTQGILSPTQAENLSKYLQNESPPKPVKRKRTSTSEDVDPGVAVYSKETCSDISQMQTHFLYGSIVRPGSNIVTVCETFKTSDLPIVRSAWQVVIRSEPVFRSQMRLVGGRGKIYHSPTTFSEWNECTVSHRDQYLALINAEPQETLLGTSFEVVTLDDRKSQSLSTIIWRSNHGLIDGYSANLIYTKLRKIVNHIEPPRLVSMADISSEIFDLECSSRDLNKHFWSLQQKRFPGARGSLDLPARQSKDDVHLKRISSVSITFSTLKLSNRATITGVSVASIYHAAWALTLSKFSDSDIVQFGAVLSGRNLDVKGIENTVGALVNTLPLNVLIDTEASVDEYLHCVYKALIELASVHCSGPDNGFDREFDSLLAMQFPLAFESFDTIALPVLPPRVGMIGDIPISVSVWPDGLIKLDYHTSRFARKDMQNIAAYFLDSLATLSTQQVTMRDVFRDLAPSKIAQKVLGFSNAFSDSTNPGTLADDLVMRFERTVRDYGWIAAVEKDSETLSYSELDWQATQVASHLATIVGPDDVVCVSADRSITWIVAVYGVLKAGALYSPMDPDLPASIKETNFESCDAKVFLVGSDGEKALSPSDHCHSISIEELLREPLEPTALLQHRKRPRPSDSAYLCFTSGSSGKPKGVVCTHEGLLAFHGSHETRMSSAPGNRVAQTMSPAFDGSIHEIFSALGWGSTLVLASSDDPFSHLRFVQSAVITPSIAMTLDPHDYPELRTINVVGEPLPQRVSDNWSSGKILFNMYGPTECTCGATTKRMKPGMPVTAGQPNATIRLYILDRHGNLCPPGVTGEIYLAGIQVARGYVRRPSETSRRFLVDPFVGHGKQKMYRTGDRGFWNDHGEVECLGRNDRIIKLRGFRLDLDDLETRIVMGVPNVTAVAVVRKDDNLIAMVQPESLDTTETLARMENVLPPYAVPASLLMVDDLPRSAVGKTDYATISKRASETTLDVLRSKTVQLSATEETVSTIWRDILNIGKDTGISPQSDFRLLGGHSLLQLVQIERLRQIFGVDIPIKTVIEDQKLSAVSRLVDTLSRETPAINDLDHGFESLRPLGRNNLSALDREWWFKYQASSCHTTSFTVAYAVSLDTSQIDLDRLCAAWNAVIMRHELLRSRHVEDGNGNPSRIYECVACSIIRVCHVDLRKEINLPFNLALEPPIRVSISPDTMLVCLSHIVCDYTALLAILEELASAYAGTSLLMATSTFADTIAWSTPVAPATLEFWKQTMDSPPAPLFLPRSSYTGTSRMFRLPSSLYRGMQSLCDARGVTLHQFALAAVALVFTLDTDQTDIILGAPFLNRSGSDAFVVGNFVTTLPVRVTYPLRRDHSADDKREDSDNASSCETFVEAVRQSSQSSLAHAVPSSHILAALATPGEVDGSIISSIPNDPLGLEVMVTLHDERGGRNLSHHQILPGATPLTVWADGAKFKLMCEFLVIEQDIMMLRVEWDESVAGDAVEMQNRVGLMRAAMEGLVEGLDFKSVKSKLREVRHGLEIERCRAEEPLDIFGSSLMRACGGIMR